MKTKRTASANETYQIGFELGLLLKGEPHVVILLDGDLGAGKTTFAQGIAKGYGINDIVNSPTFTIMKRYQTKDRMHHFYHLDLYRLHEVGNDFDLEEYIDGQGMVVIEWPYQVSELMPKDYLLVKINKIDDQHRELVMTCVGFPCKRAVEKI